MLLNLFFAWVYWMDSLEACGIGMRGPPRMRLEHVHAEPQPVLMKRMTTDFFCNPSPSELEPLKELCELMKNLPVRVSSGNRGGFKHLSRFNAVVNQDRMAPIIEFETPFEVDGTGWWEIKQIDEANQYKGIKMVLQEGLQPVCTWRTDMHLFTEGARTPMDDRKLSREVGKLLEFDGKLVDPSKDEILHNEGIFSLTKAGMGGCLGQNFKLFVQILDPIKPRFRVVGLHSPALDTVWSQSVLSYSKDQCLKHYQSQAAIQIG